MVFPETVNDSQTLETMERAWKRYRPYAGSPQRGGLCGGGTGGSRAIVEGATVVTLATGHPAKYPDLIKRVTGREPETNDPLVALRKESSPVAIIPPRIDALEAAIAGAC